MIALNLLRTQFTIHSQEKQRELLAEAQKGDLRSRNELIESAMPWVMKLASRIYSIRRPPHLELDDLIQAGFFGLHRAIEKFDLSKFGNKFLTYASYWIKNQMNREIYRCKAYKVPPAVQRQADRGELKNEHTLRSVLHFKEMMVIDHNSGGSGETGAYDYEGNASPSKIFESRMGPEESAERNEELCFLQEAIDSLEERPRRILQKRLSGMILKDIGKEEGCTRERVRQILVRAEEDLTENLLIQNILYLRGKKMSCLPQPSGL